MDNRHASCDAPGPAAGPFAAVRARLAPYGSPIVVFNKSHSGSRLLARLIEAGGVFMGANCNESRDSLDLLRLVEYLVTRYYPDYGPLWAAGASHDPVLPDLLAEVFAAHLAGFPPGGGRWGWKLCETTFIVPVLEALFPGARYLHLIRDGRDVAFCDHTPANRPFWKKVYFNTDRIERWRTRALDRRTYDKRSHLFNTLHWINSVEVGRAYGAMLRERCLEVRYEDLCHDFEATAARVLAFTGAGRRPDVVAALAAEVYTTAVGKHRDQPRRKQREVLELAGPLLLSLGYLEAES